MSDRDPHDQIVPDSAPAGEERPIFAATLTAYRSLNARNFNLVMILFGGVTGVAGLWFLAQGAWPVFGFFGLDVLALYIAFRVNYRAGRAFEEIAVSRARLRVRKVAANGSAREFSFNPYWARLVVARRPEGVVDLSIAHRQERLAIAQVLNPEDRESFAKAFAAALATARAAPAA